MEKISFQACFKTMMTHEMASFVNFQIGKLYFYYTKNIELARHHLEQAVFHAILLKLFVIYLFKFKLNITIC